MVTLTVTEQTTAELTLVEAEAVTLEAEATTYVDISQIYDGPYEWTPSDTEQAIPIGGFKAAENIIINPIPSNYGLITWNGSTLTVS